MHIGYELSIKLLQNAAVKQLGNHHRGILGPVVQEYCGVC